MKKGEREKDERITGRTEQQQFKGNKNNDTHTL